MPGTDRQLMIGMGLGWVVLPVFVITANYARNISPGDSIALVLCAGIVGGAIGLVIGAGGLGWPGLTGVMVGALSGVLLPYLVIAPILGIHTTDVRAYDTYSSTAVGAVVGSAIGTVLATRSAFRIEIRPVLPLAVGLVVLAFWLTFWVLWELAGWSATS